MVLLVVFLLVPVGCGAAPAETRTAPDDGGLSDTETYTIRVEPTTNQPPEAVISILPTSSQAGETVSFSAADSTDPDGYIKKYEWDFGDGTKDEGVSVTHAYKAPGTYNVTLTVTDNGGATDIVVLPNESPPAIGTYTVQSGDTLMGISRKLFNGDPKYWDEIAALNGIGPPYTIYPGDVLKVPEQ